MDFAYTDKVKALQAKLQRFMDDHVYPSEQRHRDDVQANRARGNAWVPLALIEELKDKARAQGLWNLFWPKTHGGELTNLDGSHLSNASVALSKLSNSGAVTGQVPKWNGSSWAPGADDHTPPLPAGAIYRWAVFHTYDENIGWLMGNSSNMFGGIQPSDWTDYSA